MMIFVIAFVLFMVLVLWEAFWGSSWEVTEDYLISVRECLEEWDDLEAQFVSWGGGVSSPLLGREYEAHARVVEEVRGLLEGDRVLMGWEEEAVVLACEYLRGCLKSRSF